MIVRGGKLGLSQAVAAKEIDQVTLNLLAERYALVGSVRATFYEVLALQRRATILADVVKLAEAATAQGQKNSRRNKSRGSMSSSWKSKSSGFARTPSPSSGNSRPRTGGWPRSSATRGFRSGRSPERSKHRYRNTTWKKRGKSSWRLTPMCERPGRRGTGPGRLPAGGGGADPERDGHGWLRSSEREPVQRRGGSG